MSTGRGLGDMAVQVACAFSEAFFAVRHDNDGVQVPLEQAHVFAAGRVDLWDGWYSQSPAVKQLVGRFLRLRHNELAAQNRFFAAARRQFTAADASYALPAGVPLYEAIDIVPMHGQEPLAFAAQILDDMEEIQEGKRVLLETAAPGAWSFGWQGQSTVELPVQPGSQNSPPGLPVVMTAPPLGEIKISRQELEDLARELDQAAGQSWRHGIIHRLLAGLRDSEDLPVGELMARAGRLHILNAPTGVGKSVLNRLLAIQLARAGIRVCLVGTNINEALHSSADMQADLSVLAQQPGQRTPSCAPLVSTHRMYDKAVAAATAGDWSRAEDLGYGCALKTYVVDGPLPEPGHEPCTGLRPVPPPGSKTVPGGRSACLWRNHCGRHRLMREAVQADIIVTYHHMLSSGHVPVPVCLDGVEVEGLSALELVMRACPVILIDEIDQFQSILVDAGTKDVVCSRPRAATTRRCRAGRSRISAGRCRRGRTAVSCLRLCGPVSWPGSSSITSLTTRSGSMMLAIASAQAGIYPGRGTISLRGRCSPCLKGPRSLRAPTVLMTRCSPIVTSPLPSRCPPTWPRSET